MNVDVEFCSLPLKKTDEKKLDEILKRPYFNLEITDDQILNNPTMLNVLEKVETWKSKIIAIKENKRKAEIEALYETNDNSLIEYIYQKLFLY